ncbi:MAG TPA: HAMP domain-containing sensor histidine kinase [Flexilinea sp.]|nr:HAMP domain-containing sensor histidine kinase [Flexilinea sp.]
MKNLRLQFILSHTLPVLITIPLVGIALSYAMETHLILKDMKQTIQDQAALITQYSEGNPEVLKEEQAAEQMIQEIRPNLVTGVILFDHAWNVLATTDEDKNKITQRFPPPMMEMEFGQSGLEPVINISKYNPFKHSEDIIEMMVPVTNSDNQLLGLIRLNFPVTYFEEQLKQTSNRILLILICGVILGVLFGLINAISLEKRLSRTTGAIYDLSLGIRNNPLPEEGPEEMQKLAKAFNSLSQKLDSSEQTRTKLVSYLTHELGRPLGGLSSAVDALQMGAAQDEKLVQDLTVGMKNEIKRLELLVGDIALLREKTDPINLYVMKPVALSAWLNEVCSYWAEYARDKDIKLVDEIDQNLPTIKMDENRMYQAVGNLLSNAIKYSPNGKTVTFRAFQTDDEIQIQVTDQGCGIDREDLPHIFESFYRGSENKRIIQGMGLGLTISQDVVQAHRGTITVESEKGVGSTFTIHLPLKNISPEK